MKKKKILTLHRLMNFQNKFRQILPAMLNVFSISQLEKCAKWKRNKLIFFFIFCQIILLHNRLFTKKIIQSDLYFYILNFYQITIEVGVTYYNN